MSIFYHRCRTSALRFVFLQAGAATTVVGFRRNLATHRNDFDFATRGSTLSQALDTKQNPEPKHDSVGPFQLGLSQDALRTGKKMSKWSELDTKGKGESTAILRTTARTTNLGVILLGAGLSAVLIYALTSELFSKNSATVLYGEACERIKASTKIAKYLNGPLAFHNNPPSSIRPRHRNRHVTSQILLDSYGQEHMILSFYVTGQPEGSQQMDKSYLEAADEWIRDTYAMLPELKWEDATAWSKDCASDVWDQSIRAFKYLSGAPAPPVSSTVGGRQEAEQRHKKESSTWDFVGMFSGLKGRTGTNISAVTKEDHRTFLEGDVHADLIRNKDGYFVFRYLVVDIPNSRDPNALRIFVERAPDVRHNERVMRWVSSL